MNKKRLLKLADLLVKVTRSKFNVAYFVDSGWNNKFDINQCGSTACALGHAGLYEPFRRLGFRTDKKREEVTYKVKGFDLAGFPAAAQFFDLDPYDVRTLFDANAYSDIIGWDTEKVTPKMVAKRIRGFVKDGY